MFVHTIYVENSNDNMSVEVSDKKLHHLNQVLRLRAVSYTHLTLPTIAGV